MIFITIGTQAPFDRLIRAVDDLILQLSEEEVIAQVFDSKYKPKNMKTVSFLDPKEFMEYFNKADLIISHAGMGTIISAVTAHKNLIIMPRDTKYKEHRNDHQLATAKKMKELGLVTVAMNEEELKKSIQFFYSNPKSSLSEEPSDFSDFASSSLINSLKEDILKFAE